MNDFNENLNNMNGDNSGVEMPKAPQMPVNNVEENIQENTVEFSGKGEPEQQQPLHREYNSVNHQRPPYHMPPQRPYPPYPHQGQEQPAPHYGYEKNPYYRPTMPNPDAPRQPVEPDYYHMTYGVPKPPVEKMSPQLRALVIIVISILVACLIGLVTFLALDASTKQKQQPYSQSVPNRGDYGNFQDPSDFFENPFDEYDDYFGDFDDFGGSQVPNANSGQTYEESDASDKVNPDYKGIQLEKKPKDKDKSSKYTARYSFDKLQDSVVGVVCYYDEDKGTDVYQSQGTGIIVTSDGYIVTNSHVIGNSRKAYLIKVITADKKEYDAGVVGYDSRSDVAVLKINAKNLPVAQFGDSAQTEITEEVIAIGNPSGIEFQNSVTKGIVSALDRKVSDSNNEEFVQIDAAINPGNSGGPLCNLYGQVVGITTSKIASELYEGMGFAIPSATVKELVDDIIRYGYVTNRVKIGITGVATYESESGANGIQIVSIAEGGPLDGTNARVDDIITAVDGQQVTNFAEIFDILEQHKEGDKVKVKLYRPSSGKTLEVEIKLQVDKAEG